MVQEEVQTPPEEEQGAVTDPEGQGEKDMRTGSEVMQREGAATITSRQEMGEEEEEVGRGWW